MGAAYDSSGHSRKPSDDSLGSNQKRFICGRETKDFSRAVRGMAAKKRKCLPISCVLRRLGTLELVALYFPVSQH
jgi:hypothetical protein